MLGAHHRAEKVTGFPEPAQGHRCWETGKTKKKPFLGEQNGEGEDRKNKVWSQLFATPKGLWVKLLGGRCSELLRDCAEETGVLGACQPKDEATEKSCLFSPFVLTT